MKSNAILKIEFMVGTSIKEAIIEASELAKKLNLAYCRFNFNDVDMHISQNCDVGLALVEFDKIFRAESEYKFVVK